MRLLDTHCHLYDVAFDDDREDVVRRAVDAGVTTMLLPAIDPQTHKKQQTLADTMPHCFYEMMGLHPTSVGVDYQVALEKTRDCLFSHPTRYVAVGEIGLDFYWDRTYEVEQENVFRQQLRWAEELDKPVTLHIRSAYDRLFDILFERNACHTIGVLHCFSGTLSQAFQAIEMGFRLGIGGVVTFKKSTLPAIVASVPLESLLLETDAPYLAPVPYRGKRNESAFLVEVAKSIAAIKDVSTEEVAAVTSASACELFRID